MAAFNGLVACLARRSVSTSAARAMCRKYGRDDITGLREPMSPLYGHKPKTMKAEDAMKLIKSGDSLFSQGAAATPLALHEALAEYGAAGSVKDVKICHIHTEGEAPYMKPELKDAFRANCFFVGSNARKAVNDGRADFVPIFLSEIPLLFYRNIIPIDVALISITPPNEHGFCSYGTSVDVTRAALQTAEKVIAQVNDRLPRTHGDGVIHISQIDAVVECSREMPEHPHREIGDTDDKIGKLIANNLVEDGATLQMGIGAIPDAVLNALKGHKYLGVHSEMFTDGLIDLIESGAVTNQMKHLLPGKTVTAFAVGSRRLFDFIHDNPYFHFKDVLYTNMASMIAKNPKVTAINSAIEVDLTGQVVADSIGERIFSGVGGQVDFLRGASIALDGRGKPILALASATNKGQSKIVPKIKGGAGVVTTRAQVHYIVTEWGIANLWGKNLRQRAYELIRIAHPDHREWLEAEAFKRLKVMPCP